MRRRTSRVALPLVAWAWLALRDHHPTGWACFWRELLAGPVFYHLWYVYVLLGLFFVSLGGMMVARRLPILRRVIGA